MWKFRIKKKYIISPPNPEVYLTVPESVQELHGQQPSTYTKPEPASAIRI
jgi:hypothetical protein